MVGASKFVGAATLRSAVALFFLTSILCASPIFVAPANVVFITSARAAADPTAETGLEGLVIVTHTGRHAFRVEVARTEDQLKTGLMYRRSLPADRGMIFDFKTPQTVMMWMKNTYIPLDMIFISRNRNRDAYRQGRRAFVRNDHSVGRASLRGSGSERRNGKCDRIATWRQD